MVKSNSKMKNPIIKLIILHVLLAAVLLIVYYFSCFLLGYASSGTFLKQKRLFFEFFIFHMVLAIFLLFRSKQINLKGVLAAIMPIAIIYLLAAWQWDYLS